jgi:hypothetical protein
MNFAQSIVPNSTCIPHKPPHRLPKLRLKNHLCCPELANSLCDTDIVCLERVQRNTEQDSCATECPHGCVTDHRHTLLGEVVDDARLETDVRVDDEQGAEDRISDGVQRASGEGGNCEGNETGGDDPATLSAPLAVDVPFCSSFHVAGKGIRLYIRAHCSFTTATPSLNLLAFRTQRREVPTSQSSSGTIRECSRGWGPGRAPVTCLRSRSMR